MSDYDTMLDQVSECFGYLPKFTWKDEEKLLIIHLAKEDLENFLVQNSVYILHRKHHKLRLALVEKIEIWYDKK